MSRSKPFRRAIRALTRIDAITTALDLVGAAAVSFGAFLVYLPAGFVVAGGFVLAASHFATPAPPPAAPERD